MSFKDIQEDVDKWTKQFNPQYWPPLEQLGRLAEETGEVARIINHLHGTKKKKPTEEIKSLGQELSDVIFTVCCIANSHNINLEEEWKKMMQEKQYGRDNERYEKIKI
ncbi:MAG: nucleotide pyrophosphohydrolase [Nanoarchaeota archaeon]